MLIEQLLTEVFNAKGDGLSSKFSLVSHHFSFHTRQAMSDITYERNQLAHRHGYHVSNRQQFSKNCEIVLQEIEEIKRRQNPPSPTPWFYRAGFVAAASIVFFAGIGFLLANKLARSEILRRIFSLFFVKKTSTPKHERFE